MPEEIKLLNIGPGNPGYVEIGHPSRKHGPSFYFHETNTGRLYRHLSNCPTNPDLMVGELVKDEGLIRLLLGINESTIDKGTALKQ